MSNAVRNDGMPRLFPIKPDLLEKVSSWVSEITGVQLGERQRGMVEGRLRKRLLDLEITSSDEYLAYLTQHKEAELQILVGLLTTHHTYFFREFSHFEYLETEGLAGIVAAARAQGRKTLKVWSAAASTGQESYSLSMFLRYHLKMLAPDFKYEILGTDVDPKSIATASNGVYQRKEIKDIPLQYLSGSWVRGTGDISEYVKAKADIKSSCSFRVGNLLELDSKTKTESFDIIFCRNVFIYFTPEQVEKITRALVERLVPEGRLFLGISESLRGSDLKLRSFGPSIYGHVPAAAPKAASKSVEASVAPAAAPVAAAPVRKYRVLCVDDSPSVLTLLKQVLKDQHGYEIVGTAKNGIEAQTKVKELAPDLMTLDIHMPEMDGLTYLKKNFGPNHPPVIMVSSVSRDDADLAVQCLNAGASDYVEKPALANLEQRGEELRAKLSSAFRNKLRAKAPLDLSLEKSFATTATVTQPDTKLRIIVAPFADRRRAIDFLSTMKSPCPPTLLLLEGGGAALSTVGHSLEGKVAGKEIRFQAAPAKSSELVVGRTLVGDFDTHIDKARTEYHNRRTSILVFGQLSPNMLKKLAPWKDSQVLVEDLGPSSTPIGTADRVPATSFGYMSDEYLGRKNGRD